MPEGATGMSQNLQFSLLKFLSILICFFKAAHSVQILAIVLTGGNNIHVLVCPRNVYCQYMYMHPLTNSQLIDQNKTKHLVLMHWLKCHKKVSVKKHNFKPKARYSMCPVLEKARFMFTNFLTKTLLT